MNIFGHGEQQFKCPYKGCEKEFDKPTVITDSTAIPRVSFYACPHCMSKLDIETQGLKVTGIRATEYPMVFDSPAKCAVFNGGLNNFPSDGCLPDECLVCPKMLQCSHRRR